MRKKIDQMNHYFSISRGYAGAMDEICIGFAD